MMVNICKVRNIIFYWITITSHNLRIENMYCNLTSLHVTTDTWFYISQKYKGVLDSVELGCIVTSYMKLIFY